MWTQVHTQHNLFISSYVSVYLFLCLSICLSVNLSVWHMLIDLLYRSGHLPHCWLILTTTLLMASCTPTWVPALTRWWQYATSLWWHPSPLWPKTKSAANQKLRMFAPWPSTCPLPTSPSARVEEYWWEPEKEGGRDAIVVLTRLHLHVFFWLDIMNRNITVKYYLIS